MQFTRVLHSYKTPPTSLRAGITKGWALTHSIPERLYPTHMRNYLKVYYTIKSYLETQNVRLMSFNMVPHDTTTVVSMNIFWYKPVYRQAQSRHSKVFKPWAGWQSRWSRPPITLWRPRLVQNMTHERALIQGETQAEVGAFNALVAEQKVMEKQQRKAQRAAQRAAQSAIDATSQAAKA